MSPSYSPQQHEVPEQSTDQVVNERFRVRLRRWRALLLAVLFLFVTSLIVLSLQGETSRVALAPDNPHADGTQALAQLLASYGVRTQVASSAEQATEAAQAGATVVIVNPSQFDANAITPLINAGSDVVVLGTAHYVPAGFSQAVVPAGKSLPATTIPADCSDPAASAAKTISGSTYSLQITDSHAQAIGCFPMAKNTYGLVKQPLAHNGTLYLIADSALATNALLDEDGNAALMIRIMGQNKDLIWLDAATLNRSSIWDSPSYPRWLPVLLFQGTVFFAVLAFVWGRRFGPIVKEPLPVVVRASETTLGRGRLYRKVKDRQHAAAALRAGTALRLGRQMGVPLGASSSDLIQAICAASNYPAQTVQQLLYGPSPATDAALGSLARQLTQLENEVSH